MKNFCSSINNIYTYSVVITIFIMNVKHSNDITKNIIVYLYLYFCILSFSRLFDINNDITTYQIILLVYSVVFWFIASILSFKHFGKVNQFTVIIFYIWIWCTTYFMLSMSFSSVYEPKNQDVISNVIFLFKVTLFFMFFCVVIFYSIDYVFISELPNNNLFNIIKNKFFSFGNFIETYIEKSIFYLIVNIANVSMLFDIIRLYLTNFIDKDNR